MWLVGVVTSISREKRGLRTEKRWGVEKGLRLEKGCVSANGISLGVDDVSKIIKVNLRSSQFLSFACYKSIFCHL